MSESKATSDAYLHDEKDAGQASSPSGQYVPSLNDQPNAEAFTAPPSMLEKMMGPTLARYYGNPYSQVVLIGFVAFLCPGMFNALGGMGGGGQVDRKPSDLSNTALYATFSVTSFFAGSIHNKIGTRMTLWLGSLGYSLYVASYLSYNFNKSQEFLIVAGAILGVCAGLFWTAQGAAMLCYPTEAQKGRFIAIFWSVFNMGAVIGSAVAMGMSWDQTSHTLGNGTYAAFIVLTFCGGLVAALLKAPGTVTRSDGSSVSVPKQTTWKFEIYGLYRILKTDPWVILLFPMFLASNFFYTWQNNAYNAVKFTLRTRALNSLLYWLAQIFGAFFVSAICDSKLKRKTRAWLTWSAVLVIVFAVWGASYHEQTKYTRHNLPDRLDFTAGAPFVGPCFLYLFSGFMDAVWQCFTYWLMGSVSNDMSKLAMLTGFYKCIQSAGAAGAFGLDLNEAPFMTILGVTWGLCGAGLLFSAPVIALRLTEHTDPLSDKIVPGRELEV